VSRTYLVFGDIEDKLEQADSEVRLSPLTALDLNSGLERRVALLLGTDEKQAEPQLKERREVALLLGQALKAGERSMSKLGEFKKETPSLAKELAKLGLSPAEQQELEEEMAEEIKKAMKLTADEIKWARELGDTPEEYAAAKREIMLVTEAMTRKDPKFAVILEELFSDPQASARLDKKREEWLADLRKRRN
jgi:hypothetical protein